MDILNWIIGITAVIILYKLATTLSYGFKANKNTTNNELNKKNTELDNNSFLFDTESTYSELSENDINDFANFRTTINKQDNEYNCLDIKGIKGDTVMDVYDKLTYNKYKEKSKLGEYNINNKNTAYLGESYDINMFHYDENNKETIKGYDMNDKYRAL